jgi:hypothetical protein
MGKPAVIDNAAVIDETFAGLANASETFEIGNDVTGERPGAILIDAVKQFEKDGGFKRIQETRNADLVNAEIADAAARAKHKIDLDISLPSRSNQPEADRDIKED